MNNLKSLKHTDSNLSEYDMNMGGYMVGTPSLKSGSTRGNGRKEESDRGDDSLAFSSNASDNDSDLQENQPKGNTDCFDETNGGDAIDDLFMQQQYPSNLNNQHSPSKLRNEFTSSPQRYDAFEFDEVNSDHPFFPANKVKSDERESKDREDLAALRATAKPKPPTYARGTPRSEQSTPRISGLDSVDSRSAQRDNPIMNNKDKRSAHRLDGNANTVATVQPNLQPTSQRQSPTQDSSSHFDPPAKYSSKKDNKIINGGSSSTKSSKVDKDIYKLKADLYRLHQDDDNDEEDVNHEDIPYESRFEVPQQEAYETPSRLHSDNQRTADDEMEEWQKVFDDSYQMYYYYNNYTGESTWDIPEALRSAEGWGGDTSNIMASALEIINTGRSGMHSARSGMHTGRSVTSTVSRPPSRRPTQEQRESILKYLTGKNEKQSSETPPYNATLNSRVVGTKYEEQKNSQSGSESEDEGEENNISEHKGIAKGAHLLTEAIGGIYDVSELLEDEQARSTRKFEGLKETGSIMRTRLGWEEWLSGQGAVFYAQRGRSGGQWDVPQPFARLEQEQKVMEKNKSRLKRRQYHKDEAEKSSQYTFMLQGWEEKAEEEEALRGARSGVKDFSNVDGLVEAEIVRDVFEIRQNTEQSRAIKARDASGRHRIIDNENDDAGVNLQYVDQEQRHKSGNERHPLFLDAPNYGEGEEVTGEMIDILKDKERFHEYGNNIKLADRYSGKLNEVTAGMKEVYRALRQRDSRMDVSINAAALEERTEKAKARWRQYVEMKEERNRALFGGDVVENDDDDDDNRQMDFTKLYSRSVIVRQRWPWSKLVDIETDKTFYRNEAGDYFQFEAPPEFEHEVDIEGSDLKRHTAASGRTGAGGAVDGSKVAVADKRRRGLFGAGNVGIKAKDDDKGDNMKSERTLEADDRTILRGNYNVELLQRREHMTAVHKKQREEELIKSQGAGSSLKRSERREKTNRAKSRNLSIFHHEREKGDVKSFLDDYLPPKNFRISPQEAKEKWKNLSDLESNKSQEKFDIGWHDATTLIIRLRRFSELKKYAESANDNACSPTRAQRQEATTSSSHIQPLENASALQEIRENSSLLRSTESHRLFTSQSFANQALMMESRGEPFICSNTQSSFRNARKDRDEKLEELDRTATLKRVVSHHKKRTFNEMRAAVVTLSHYLDTYESTFFETEIIRRHLLEAAVMLRFCQSVPIRKREAKAYVGLPVHLTAPHILKVDDIMKISTADMDPDQRLWKKFTFSQNEFGNPVRPNPSDLFTLYAHNKTGRVQRGVPFDLKLREWKNNELKVLRWYKYGRMYDASRTGKKAITLLADMYKGILFHCPIRKVFDWKEKMEYSYYDIPPDNARRKGKKAIGEDLKKNVLSSDSSSGSDSDNEKAMVIARKKKLKERLDALTEQNEATVKTGKAARVYKTQAMEEHRSLNIWADLNMTKTSTREERYARAGGLGMKSASTLYEQSSSTATSAKNPALSTAGVKVPAVSANKSMLNSPAEIHGNVKHYFDPDKVQVRKFLDYFEGILLSNPVSPPFVVDVRKPKPPRYSPSDEKDHDPLEFEEELAQKDYDTYYDLIFDLYENPDHVPTLAALASFLLTQKLGRETLIVFVRILEVSNDKQYASSDDLAAVILCLCNLSCKYMSDYRVSHILTDIVNMCPESALILGLCGRLFHKLKLLDKAEELYIGALLIDPESAVSLRGYALLLTEKGNHAAAARYLSRVDEHAPHYATAKVEYGWIQELLGKSDEVLQLDYQRVISTGLKTRESTLALAALGHFHHVRGEPARARAFYQRCLHQNPDNAYCLLLFSCLQATEVGRRNELLPSTRTIVEKQGPLVERSGGGEMKFSLEVAEEDENIDAQFRRGLFFMQSPNSNRWIGLLAYAEFVANRLQDCKRAEDIFWESARLSCKYAVWAVIALAHFYQYVWDDVVKAKKVMLWAERKRRVPIVNEVDEDDYIDEHDEDVFLRPNKDEEKKQALIEQNKVLLTLRSEDACMHVTHAFIYFDQNNQKECLATLRKALDCDNKSSAAYRLWGLLDWKQGKKHEAMYKFEKAFKYAPYNPYTLRTYSVACAIMGLYNEAVDLMQRAVQLSGMDHPLACRACGIMTYLYDSKKGKERCLTYFQKAYDMSGGLDFEAGRLKAQVLMELGKFEAAVSLLREILPLKPTDSIALGSLALSLSALGHKSPTGTLKVNYPIKIKLMSAPQELLQSSDPEELFEAATTFNLGQAFLQKIGKGKGAVLSKGWGILNNVAVDEPIDALEAHDSDVPPPVLFWYGMYQLQRGGPDGRKAARSLFLRATQRQDYSPHLLSLHKLGWIAETTRDLRAAERYYCSALQLDPIDPHAFLQLSQLVRDTNSYVHLLKPRQYGDPNSDIEVATRLQARYLATAEKKSKPTCKKTMKKKKKKTIPGKNTNSNNIAPKIHHVEASPDDVALDTITLQQRRLLHERVHKLLNLRMSQMKKHLEGMTMPGLFVYLEPLWLEQFMICFSDCEDWAWQLKTSMNFRKLTAEKKKANSDKY